MIDEYPTYQDMVMALGPDGAENRVLGRVFYGEELCSQDHFVGCSSGR